MNMGFFIIIAGVALHGICFDFFFVTGQVYVDQSTDPRIKAQAQSMIVFFTQGLGMYIGSLFNEMLFLKAFNADNIPDAFGKASNINDISMWNNSWWPLAGIAAVIFVIFLVAFRYKEKPEDRDNFSH